MIAIPSIKKTVKKFILDESGAITKTNVLKLGVLIAGYVSTLVVKNVEASRNAHASSGVSEGAHNSGADSGAQAGHADCTGHDSGHCSHSSGHGNWNGHGSHTNVNNPTTRFRCSYHDNDLSLTPIDNGGVTGRHYHNAPGVDTGPEQLARIKYYHSNSGGSSLRMCCESLKGSTITHSDCS